MTGQSGPVPESDTDRFEPRDGKSPRRIFTLPTHMPGYQHASLLLVGEQFCRVHCSGQGKRLAPHVLASIRDGEHAGT